MFLKIGDEAPLFCLPNQDNIEICLRDFRGSFVIIYFYPKDSTPGCTREACDFSVNIKKFLDFNAHVFGISTDSVESHQKFIQKQDLKITLLSDKEHKVCEQYGVWGEKKMYGKTYYGIYRSTFLIHPDGKIYYIWEKVKVDGHVDLVLQELHKKQ